MKYKPTREAQLVPRRMKLDGEWRGIGGELQAGDVKYKEATQKQYEKLYKQGCNLVEIAHDEEE